MECDGSVLTALTTISAPVATWQGNIILSINLPDLTEKEHSCKPQN